MSGCCFDEGSGFICQDDVGKLQFNSPMIPLHCEVDVSE